MIKRSAFPKLSAGLATRLAAGLAAGLLALASCGGSDASLATVPADVDLTVIAIEGIAWNAKTYAATATDGRVVIAAKNDSSLPHNLHVIDASGVENPSFLDIPRRGVVDSKSFTLAPGTYTVICKIAGHTNMKATLEVS